LFQAGNQQWGNMATATKSLLKGKRVDGGFFTGVVVNEPEHESVLILREAQQLVCTARGDGVWGPTFRWRKIKGRLVIPLKDTGSFEILREPQKRKVAK